VVVVTAAAAVVVVGVKSISGLNTRKSKQFYRISLALEQSTFAFYLR